MGDRLLDLEGGKLGDSGEVPLEECDRELDISGTQGGVGRIGEGHGATLFG